jgi:hypothetical protein
MHFKRFIRSKLAKSYIILNKEVLYAWKYPKVNPTINNYYLEVIRIQTIIIKESYGTKT